MVRSKVSLELISDQRRRNATFMKRRTGLKKKAMELATLCNVPTLLLCLGPRGQVEVWPEDRGEAYAIIDRFHSASVEDRRKHRFDVSSFFGDVVMKGAGVGAEAGLDQGGEEEGDLGQHCCSEEPLLGLISPESSLQELEWRLDARLMAIEERMGALGWAEASLQGGEQGQLQYYGLQLGLFNSPPGPAGEETSGGMVGSWGGDLNGGPDEDPATVLSDLHQNLMLQYPLMMMHGGTATAPPPAYNPTPTFPEAPFFFPPHSDNMGVMGVLDDTLVFNTPLSAPALTAYPCHDDGGYNAQYSCLNDAKMGCSTVAPPCRPRSAFLDYNGADGSAPCALNCCCSRCPVIMSGDVIMLRGGGGGGGGASEQQLVSSNSRNGDVEHRREELQHCGVGLGFLPDDTVEEGFENPWSSYIYPPHPYPSSAIMATPLAANGCCASFGGS